MFRFIFIILMFTLFFSSCEPTDYIAIGGGKCDDISCGDNGSCELVDNKASCNCNDGYLASELNCISVCANVSCDDWNECSNGICVLKSDRCLSNDKCLSNEICNNPTKSCVNPCDTSNCSGHGTCVINDHISSCNCDITYSPSVVLTCVPVVMVEDCGSDGMCNIPKGSFMMGCNDDECYGDGDDDEYPQHAVTLSAYKIDKYEVTAQQFKKCVTEGSCKTDNFIIDTHDYYNYNILGREKHPMNYVKWLGAKEYCAYLGKRLPTEAEWEYAARGVNSTKYPWGNTDVSCDKAVFYGCNEGHTSKVGTKEAGKSPFGLYDMTGNVSEWVEDYYKIDFYSNEAVTNPLNDSNNGNPHVIRGGSWATDLTENMRSSFRAEGPDNLSLGHGTGFRCAKSQ